MYEPDTRPSLMLRLREATDQEAWAQFVSIYEPLIYRVVRRRGLQEADARDVTQQVIIAVMNAVDTWKPDGGAASFRRWLFAIARKLALRFLQREFQHPGPGRFGAGGTDMILLLHSLPEPTDRTVEAFDQQYRDSVFHWAVDRIRAEFRDSVWNAFWRTFVLNQPIAVVAEDLGMSLGYVYVARGRVIARLKRLVEEFDSETGNL